MSKSTPTHPMRDFYGADGKIYQRRADIRMFEWREYIKANVLTREQEMYWVALFLGRVEPETMSLEMAEQIALADQVFAVMSTDEYAAICGAIFSDILNPVSPKNDQTQPLPTTTDAEKPSEG